MPPLDSKLLMIGPLPSAFSSLPPQRRLPLGNKSNPNLPQLLFADLKGILMWQSETWSEPWVRVLKRCRPQRVHAQDQWIHFHSEDRRPLCFYFTPLPPETGLAAENAKVPVCVRARVRVCGFSLGIHFREDDEDKATNVAQKKFGLVSLAPWHFDLQFCQRAWESSVWRCCEQVKRGRSHLATIQCKFCFYSFF